MPATLRASRSGAVDGRTPKAGADMAGKRGSDGREHRKPSFKRHLPSAEDG
jgi:hypothetical protein